MADVKWALDPLTKPGGDDVDLMTPEGREFWIERRMQRYHGTVEEAAQYVDALIDRRKAVAAADLTQRTSA